MKSTPLTDTHIGLGAKMAEFAGYNMPISYAGIREEHEAVRNSIGVFDVSHMGEFIIKGKQAFDLLQKVTSNNVAKLEIGDAQYSCLPNNEGGIVDDLLVYRLPEDKCAEGEKAYMVVVNASNIEKDWNWIEQHNNFEAEMHNISYRSGLLAVQGPKAHEAMQSLTEVDLAGMKYYTFKKGVFAGIENVLISATGYTGSGGFELYCDNKDMKQLWDAVMAAGKDYNIAPCGLGARDTLRLEMGFALYGNDINDTTSPIEAGLGWITKTKKGDFTSRDIFLKQREEGTERKLVGFVLSDRRAPRHDYPIVNAEGEEIGIVTSGTISPTLDQPIGMGYVKKEYAKAGTEITIMARKKELKAVVKRPPFVEIPK